MSKKSWLEEFYPVEAENVEERDAVAHSLQKWTGLRAKSLKRHELITPPIPVDGYSCSLCVIYREGSDDCDKCPLYLLRNGVQCDEQADDEEEPPYFDYIDYSDPEPMIELLQIVKSKQS